MKQSLLICAAAALLAGSSCSEQEPFDAAMPVRLSVAGISPGSRAAANYAADDYFGLRGMAGASVSVKARTTTYIYADGTLAGATPDDVLYFPVDGSALASVKVYWPEEAVRQAQGGAIAKDQREKEAFLAADWLSAELKEVAPAQAVALTLGHERPKLTFTLAGTMSGSRITALSVAGYDAYCDPQTGDAQLIMLPGNTEIALEAIGTVTIGGQERPRNFVVKTMPALKAGENHTIEIGDDVSIGHNVTIHGAKICNGALIGMGSVVLDHAVIGEGAIIAAGSVVLSKTIVEPGSIYAGVPAKFVKKVDPEQAKEINQKIAKNYHMYSSWYKE